MARYAPLPSPALEEDGEGSGAQGSEDRGDIGHGCVCGDGEEGSANVSKYTRGGDTPTNNTSANKQLIAGDSATN